MTTFTDSLRTGWLSAADCSLDDFVAVVDRQTQLSDYPYADAVERNVLIYGERLRATIGTPSGRRAVQTELMRALDDGPGIVVFKQAFGDLSVVDRATEAFLAQIAAEKAAGVAGGDHFAKPGANDRVWGALDKLAVTRPRGLRRVLRQRRHRTGQRGVARPGLPGHLTGQRGQPRWSGADRAPRLPPRLHGRRRSRPLPGAGAPALARADPAGRGRALRHARRDRPDPLPAATRTSTSPATSRSTCPSSPSTSSRTTPSCRWRRATPRSSTPPCSTARARTVSTTVRRMANLLQVSSPFGRAMESVDRVAMCRALFPVLLEGKAAGASDRYLENIIAASAEGYAFPTNLDRDQPIGGIAPADPGRPRPPGRRRGMDPGRRSSPPWTPRPPAPAPAPRLTIRANKGSPPDARRAAGHLLDARR